MRFSRLATIGLCLILLLALALAPATYAQDAEETEEPTEEVIATEEATEEAEEEATPEATEEAEEEEDVEVEEITITADGEVVEYRIQPGDTLLSIANRYGVTATALASYNRIVNPNLIYWGQLILIPGQGDDGDGGTGGPTPPVDEGPFDEYVVVRGDNLYRISLRFDTTMETLRRINDIEDINVIYVGQTLLVPAE